MTAWSLIGRCILHTALGTATSHIAYLYARLCAPIWSHTTPSYAIAQTLSIALLTATYWPHHTYLSAGSSFYALPLPHSFLLFSFSLAIGPWLIHNYLFSRSWLLGPVWGPRLVQSTFVWPLVCLCTLLTVDATRVTTRSRINTAIIPTVSRAFCWVFNRWEVWSYIPDRYATLDPMAGINAYKDIFMVASMIFYVTLHKSQSASPRSPTKMARMMMPQIIFGSVILLVLRNLSQSRQSGDCDIAQRGCRSSTDTRILARRFSLTGAISVAEHLEQGRWLRVLRCDHSILGGVWLDPGLSDLTLADSIYATFHVQEAVRLIKRSFHEVPRALVIGLGIGTVVNALEAHNVPTTVVEIDPVVYQFATTHFDLSKPAGGVYIMDARQHLQDTLQTYHYIVHDIFTGGSMPPHLLTIETWSLMRTRLAPEGIVVINFAGHPYTGNGKTVLNTAIRSFEHCRAFKSPEASHSEYVNMVLFCSSAPLTFRQARSADYLRTHQRKVALEQLDSLEFDMNRLRDDAERPLTDANTGRFDQRSEVIDHWYIMRSVFSSEFWQLC